MNNGISRREALGAMAALAVPTVGSVELLQRHDEHVSRLLAQQVTDPAAKWCGSAPDGFGLHSAGSAGGILSAFTAAYANPGSKYYKQADLVQRIRLAAGFLERSQTPDGNIDLLSTNFNSPPDTGFVVWGVGQAACVATKYGYPELAGILKPFLLKAGAGLAKGGIHTPNHRWVVSSALALIQAVWPDAAYVKRIDQWLAEGIDIDADGQYIERSTLVYNMVCNRSLIILASKLNRPELLDPVRRNLQSMLYLLHPGYELVTEISRRQDLNQRGTMGGYWLPLHLLAVRDRNGQFAALANEFAAKHASLPDLMDYPELSQALPGPAPLPDDYEKLFPVLQVARIRRGLTSATILLGGNSRFLTVRRGEAVINAIRFASAFFGKGQFVPAAAERRGRDYVFTQSLEAPYYQPVGHKVAPTEWARAKSERRLSEVCRLTQSATVTETPKGFRVRLQSSGTDNVPVAVEISLREGGQLEGCDGNLLRSGFASYRVGSNTLRFGPGHAEHKYTQIRGAELELPGRSVYLTGFTPFDRTLEVEAL